MDGVNIAMQISTRPCPFNSSLRSKLTIELSYLSLGTPILLSTAVFLPPSSHTQAFLFVSRAV